MFFGDKTRKQIRILSIDGGGVRGLIPALILQALDERVRAEKPESNLIDCFDLIAGTSTGGLVAAALASPDQTANKPSQPLYRPAEIVDFYLRRSEEIFPTGIYNAFRSLAQALTCKYDGQGLEKVLAEAFGELTLADCLTNLLITSYDVGREKPCIFAHRLKSLKKTEKPVNFLLKDIARATSAAPTFLPPAHIRSLPPDAKEYCLIDGAVFANDPAMIAYFAAREFWPRAQKFLIVSLGTGRSSKGEEHKDIKRWGFIEWFNIHKAIPYTRVAFQSQAASIGESLSRAADVDYYRFDPEFLPQELIMDDARSGNLISLKSKTEAFIKARSPRLDRLCERLLSLLP